MQFRSQKKLSSEVSLSETVDCDKDGNPLTYIDIIHTDDTVSDDIDKKIKIEKILSFIQSSLDSREKNIIILRYGLSGSDPLTQREVAEMLGISRSYVSRIEKSVLDRLRILLKT